MHWVLCTILYCPCPVGTAPLKKHSMRLKPLQFSSNQKAWEIQAKRRALLTSPSPAGCRIERLARSKEEMRIWPLSLQRLIITSWKGLLFQVHEPTPSVYGRFPVLQYWGVRSQGEKLDVVFNCECNGRRGNVRSHRSTRSKTTLMEPFIVVVKGLKSPEEDFKPARFWGGLKCFC